VEEHQNPMKKLKIAKVVVNMAVGASGEKLAKAAQVLEQLTGQKPSLRKAKKTIKEFGIKKGESIACVVTLTKDRAVEFLKRALQDQEVLVRRVRQLLIWDKGTHIVARGEVRPRAGDIRV
jgi:large subunit ribosomal protein L5